MTATASAPEVGGPEPSFCGMIGAHDSMKRLFDAVSRAASLDVPVVVHGETGVGKERVAEALHGLSGRRGRYVPVNVATLGDSLADAELFGSVRGSYTGSTQDRAGLIEQASHGTLLLDEAGDLPTHLQAKLLRSLESRTVRRVGDGADRRIAFRLVTTTQTHPSALVAAGRWREDFYYRVAGILVAVPALRDRQSDIPLLANDLLARSGCHPLTDREGGELGAYAWPGNIRQLVRAVERAAFEGDACRIGAQAILRAARADTIPDGGIGASVIHSLAEAEARHIRAVLGAFGFDVASAADVLGLSRSQLYRRMQLLGLAPANRR